MLRLIVLLAFFTSGASSLMLEVVWSKELSHLLGSSFEAISTVVAAYLFGLALGAGIAGRSERLAARPVRSYGLLEAGIGVFALVSIPLMRALDGPLGAAYSGLGGESFAYAAVRFAIAFATLLVPTTLMGATLPVLVAWGAKRADLGRVLGTLYAINTAGAVCGTLVAGFVLLPSVGLGTTALVAAGVSLTVGIVMVLASRGLEGAPAPAPAPATAAAPVAAKPATAAAKAAAVAATNERPRLMLAFFAVSGMVSLACQIAWSRLAATLLGSSVYSFTLVLATFLVGIAAGSALVVPVLSRRGASWRLFAILQWIAAAGILYASFRIADAPWGLLEVIASSRGDVGSMWLRESLFMAGVMLPACVAFGALFPIATRLSAMPGDTAPRTAGRAYGWNTLGTVTGSLLTGFVLLQTAGTRTTLLTAAGLALALGVAGWLLAPAARVKKASTIPEGAPIGRVLLPLAAIALFALAIAFAPRWDRGLLAMGVFRPLVSASQSGAIQSAQARSNLREAMSREELLWQREGRLATVTVHRERADASVVALRVNGKTDASTGTDMVTQVLLGQLPMLWAKDAPKALVIGYGSGVTAGGVLAQGPSQLDVIEIEPAVLEADRFFRFANGNPLADPRTKRHIEDARSFVGHGRGTYDVIVSEPSNPWVAGVNNLFTKDYFEAVRDRLAPDGVFCQWTQSYEMSTTTLASILRTLHSVFPKAELFLVQRDVLVVATRDGRPLDLARAARKLQEPTVRASFARTSIRSIADLVALHVNSLDAVIAKLPAAPFNTDDRPVVEYRAAIDLYRTRPTELPIDGTSILAMDPVADLSRWTTGANPAEIPAQVAQTLIGRGELAQAQIWVSALARRSPQNGPELANRFQRVVRERALAERLAEGRQALLANDLQGARAVFDQLVAEAPDYRAARIERARIAMREDSLGRARAMLEASLVGAGPDDQYQAECNLGILAMRQGRAEEGLAHFTRASRARPEQSDAYVYRARALSQLGRADEARAILDEADRVATDKSAIRQARDALAATRPTL
jgi:spermidine synthase